MKDTKKRFLDYMHSGFTGVFVGILSVLGGIAGLKGSIWLAGWWTNALSGYSGRMNLIMFILPYILPIIMCGVILFGAIAILSFPFDMVAKSKRAKLLKTEEGEKILSDFYLAAHYFEDDLRVGRLYLYKRYSIFYHFDKIELFKLEKKEEKILILYKNKGENEAKLMSFDKDSWPKSKNDMMAFLKKMETEHPEITLEIL